ncbi:type II toxin-antitoxin system HicB family antitoxin [Anoxybacillus ayderensis]|uniref:type II toxin-antitoxin system HicB family antitoxin n=1 Tax=Anoxybacillus ayderensis TaxID=265546 RepID=UPI001F2B3041|nr:type II toxin-antitoxin system HicB family antitoxin [Anoxybacillus ayderensis]
MIQRFSPRFYSIIYRRKEEGRFLPDFRSRLEAGVSSPKMMKKDRYIYPAIFDDDSDGISVEFPDLPGCFTCGDTEEEALQMAKEALALHLYGLEQENEVIPNPSKLSDIPYKNNKTVVFIEVWMPPFRYEMEA